MTDYISTSEVNGKLDRIEDLTGRSLRIITNNGKDGIVQSNLCKKLDLSSREGSRVAIFLEKRLLIKRVKSFENGRWTYRLIPTKLPIKIDCIDSAPCLSCPVEHMCSIDSLYGPHNCGLVEDWIVVSFLEKTQIKQKIEDHIYRDSEVVQSEKHKRGRVMVRVSKGNRKSKRMR